MRVLYLVPDLFGPPGGIARYCRMVCLALVRGGHHSTTIALLDKPTAYRAARASLPSMKYVACSRHRVGFVYRALRAALHRPDVILVGHPNFTPLGWLLARLTGARLICFIYGVDVWEPLSKWRQSALRACDQIISISRFTARHATQANGLSPERIFILHNCVDPHFEAKGNTGISESSSMEAQISDRSSAQLSLLTVSRILLSDQYKGHDQVIRSLPSLLRQFPNLIYDIVGDGDGRSEMEALAAQEGVSDAVRFHGVVSDEEVARFYSNADVFIMPSRREGFGFVFIEAMTHGTPAVGGNEDATPEVIIDGETGFTVDAASVEEIAEAASKLLSDNDLRGRMGARGAEVVASKFGFEHFRETLLKYLEDGLRRDAGGLSR